MARTAMMKAAVEMWEQNKVKTANTRSRGGVPPLLSGVGVRSASQQAQDSSRPQAETREGSIAA